MQKIYETYKGKKSARIKVENLNYKEYQETYTNLIKERIAEVDLNLTPQESWDKIVEICQAVGKETLGNTRKEKKYENKELENLSKQKEKLRKEIDSCKQKETRKRKTEEKKMIKREMNSIIKTLEQRELETKLNELEESKNDSNKCYKVMNSLRRDSQKKTLCVQNDEGEMVGDEGQKVNLITEYLKKMLAPEEAELGKIYNPTKMRTPFTAEEIKEAAKSLKNGKSTGIDEMNAEYIKYAPIEVHHKIAEIFNRTAETGKNPKELEIGILTPLPKPNKKPGPRDHLRPVILLSVLRKILTITMIKRCWERFERKIPVEQAAYQGGRSTTEQIFAIKMLAEKAIISSSYKVYILLLDMSKAFDSVNRKILFEKLEMILEPDELHLLSILTKTPKLKIKVNQTYGELFETKIGIMQGDCLSAVLFIFYLACCLEKELQNIPNKQTLILNPKYSDDITYAATEKENIEYIKTEIPNILKQNNLKVNQSKTEEYTIPKPPPPPPSMETIIKHKEDRPLWSELDWVVNKIPPEEIEDKTPNWRNCKLLGSLLDTGKDINRRRGLAINAMRKLKFIFASSRISIELKLKSFNTYVASIFLYNSELWTLTKSAEDKIDSFHTRQLRYVIGITWPKIISNKNLYDMTKAEKWSRTVKRRRLNWLGHLMRLPEDSPAYKSLVNFLQPCQKPVGRCTTTWMSIIKKDLQSANIHLNLLNPVETINTLKQITVDRKLWKNTIKVLMR